MGIYSSEISGFRHLYLQFFDENSLKITRPPMQLAKGDWEVNDCPNTLHFKSCSSFQKIYFLGKKDTPLSTHLYEIDLKLEENRFDTQIRRITLENFSYKEVTPNFDENGCIESFISIRSNLKTPWTPVIIRNSEIIFFQNNIVPMTDSETPKPFTFTNSSNIQL